MISPIVLCPVCDYDLRTLPTPHACPECGFKFDAETRMWHAKRGPSVWRADLSWAVICLVGLLMLVTEGLPRNGSQWLRVAAYSVITLWAGWKTWNRLTRRERRYLVIGSDAICIRNGTIGDVIAWNDMPDTPHENAVLALCDDLLTPSRRGGVFDNADEEQAFRDAFTRARERWAARGSETVG